MQLGQMGRYGEAIAELNAAYVEKPLPLILFNIGLYQQRLGNREAAIAAYEQYLAADLSGDPAQRLEAHNALAQLRPPPLAPYFFAPAPQMPSCCVDCRPIDLRCKPRSHRGLLSAGITLLTIGYGLSATAGVIPLVFGFSATASDVLLVPIVGPLITIGLANSIFTTPFLLLDAGMQIAGLAMTIAGARRGAHESQPAAPLAWAPWAGPSGAGFALRGHF
jgi:hypothetical protein